jgi:hypothetical protein
VLMAALNVVPVATQPSTPSELPTAAPSFAPNGTHDSPSRETRRDVRDCITRICACTNN